MKIFKKLVIVVMCIMVTNIVGSDLATTTFTNILEQVQNSNSVTDEILDNLQDSINNGAQVETVITVQNIPPSTIGLFLLTNNCITNTYTKAAILKQAVSDLSTSTTTTNISTLFEQKKSARSSYMNLNSYKLLIEQLPFIRLTEQDNRKIQKSILNFFYKEPVLVKTLIKYLPTLSNQSIQKICNGVRLKQHYFPTNNFDKVLHLALTVLTKTLPLLTDLSKKHYSDVRFEYNIT